MPVNSASVVNLPVNASTLKTVPKIGASTAGGGSPKEARAIINETSAGFASAKRTRNACEFHDRSEHPGASVQLENGAEIVGAALRSSAPNEIGPVGYQFCKGDAALRRSSHAREVYDRRHGTGCRIEFKDCSSIARDAAGRKSFPRAALRYPEQARSLVPPRAAGWGY